MGLEPLALDAQGEMDCRDIFDAPEHGDLYLPLWRELTRRPRRVFEFHRIAWSGRRADEQGEAGDCPVLGAIEMKEIGDVRSARALLMAELHDDLRYLDAHAHLGNLELDRAPEKALAHYEVAVRIGDLSLPEDDDFFLPWGCLMNRPYHRALHGYGLALYKLGRRAEAEAVFLRQLVLNPPDHVGARYALFALRDGLSWAEGNAT
ncbi:MAG: hypothetical protein AAF447_24155 [Myxococcota bacterium]